MIFLRYIIFPDFLCYNRLYMVGGGVVTVATEIEKMKNV